MTFIVAYVVFWVLVGGCGGLLIAAAMHKPRFKGFLVGALLGVFGWLLILVWKGNTRKCPRCGEQVQKSALVCRYCGTAFESALAVGSTRFCTQCGARYDAASRFCTQCGGSATPTAKKVCPRCAEEVRLAAEVCRFCQHEFAPVLAAAKGVGEPPVEGDQSGVAPRQGSVARPVPTARMLRREWIHDAPTTMSRDFGRVAAGEEVAVLDAKGKYTRIRARDGREGWAHTKSISREPSKDDDRSDDLGEPDLAIDERAERVPTPLVRTLSAESPDVNPRREFVAEIKDGFRELRRADFKREIREWYRELWQSAPAEGSNLNESSPRSDTAPRD